ncbi:NeuD/PglB/VioB family sugar acetyltransferase [Sphingomonas melonis]|uniref:NeuD/PglB/VioB family sugar acetyltransferase n=1 Tax=Sphingomonas melonis TaxID=152682 RepID=UPI000372A519|nr:NeuD/PglB/VioB family sugar acetyltransferase [Sphingomonas melonis]
MNGVRERCIAIYGASGFGREVLPLVRAQHAGDDVDIVFVDDGRADGIAILSFDAFASLPHKSKQFVVAIANSSVREMLVARCLAAGFESLAVRAANVVTLDDVLIGEGAILCPFSLLTSTIRVGRFFHANNHAYVSHDCIIGDFVTLAPGAKLNGNIHVDDHAYVGSGAVIKQGTPAQPRRIGRGAVIGMGAVVTKDVAPGETVVGNPARPLRR